MFKRNQIVEYVYNNTGCPEWIGAIFKVVNIRGQEVDVKCIKLGHIQSSLRGPVIGEVYNLESYKFELKHEGIFKDHFPSWW